MWFENAIGKEKVNFMFGGEFSLSDLELISFSFNQSTLHLSFSSRRIPKVHPEKWDKEEYNSLIIFFTFSDIIEFESKGNNVMFTSTPKITTNKNFSSIEIEADVMKIYCKSRFLTINDIKPYIDDRWD